MNRLHDISLELTHARRARITHTRKHHEEKHSTNLQRRVDAASPRHYLTQWFEAGLRAFEI
jgi:hypothetical protein